MTEDAAKLIAERAKEIEEELAELVAINSFTDNTEGGHAVGEMLARRTFVVPKLDYRVVPSKRYASHRVFSSRGDASRRPIALIGHLDTVFPPGTFEGFKRDGDLARGPGVLDMKGGLVVVAHALRAIAETIGLDATAPIRLAIVADEEVGSPEGQGVIREAIKDAKGALVFEAGRKGDAIITRRKGTGSMNAVATGRAAHAGNNHKEGKNAIWAIARFVDAAQKLSDYARGVTVNVGIVSGGTSKNTVPDEAKAQLDLRFETIADGEKLVSELRLAADAHGVEGVKIEVTGGVARQPLERTNGSVELMAAYGECATKSGLGMSEAALIGGGSDASTSFAMGIASIDGLGPRGIGFHTKDEQIEIATLVLKAQALARFLMTWK
ncbi:MAG TPA: M20/M25/M40 family metallo-hydrolase [Polyangiaceae bacterium]